MFPVNVWCLVVDHENIPIRDVLKLWLPGTLDVAGLKKKIKEEMRSDLAHVRAHWLTVFDCTDLSINLDDDYVGGSLLEKLDKVFSDNNVREVGPRWTMISLIRQCDTNGVFIVQVPDVQQRERERVDDDDVDPPEIKLLKKEVGDAAPSSLAHAANFYQITRRDHAIDCNHPFNYDALPIDLHDESFGKFKTRRGEPPSRNALDFLIELTPVACNWYGSEDHRNAEVLDVFQEYTNLRFRIDQVPGTKYTTDGNLNSLVMPAVIRQCKNGSDNALNQVIVYYAKFLLNALYHPLGYRNLNTRFPCILMVDQGSTFGFYGAVWDGRVRVEPLTTFDLSTHHLDESGRFAIASSLDAFEEAVHHIRAHYAKIQMEADIKAGPSMAMECDRRLADARKFPYMTSFEINRQKIACTYKSRLSRGNLLFSVVISNRAYSGDFIVKFTRRYSAEAHQCLASHGAAPRIWQHKEIPGGWIVTVMEKSRYSLLRDLTLSKENQEKVLSKVMMMLKKLHDEGLVHGDIRSINLLVDYASLASNDAKDVRVHFIDFDWAGRVGETKYPLTVNTEGVKRPDGVAGGALITKEHDESMVTYLFS